MRRPDLSLFRMACLVLAAVFPVGLLGQDVQPTTREIPAAATNSPESAPSSAAAPALPIVEVPSDSRVQLPDSPGTEWAKMSASQDETASQQSNSPAQQQANSDSKNQAPQRPLGTAAAEAPKVSGITAAEPAGVAIAPAKQRRVRTIVLKVGAILAGGAALGAVIALSAGTSSKPPGAH